MRVLLVSPMRREAAAVSGAVISGAGAAAAAFVDDRLRGEGYDLVVLAGVCGGLDPSLAPGSLIVGRRVVAPGGGEHVPDERLLESVRQALRGRMPFVSSALLTVDRPVESVAARRDAWNEYGAAGIDMETFGVGSAAERHGVPWLALRTVVDPASATLPSSLARWRGDEDERAVVRAALARPHEWLAYARLAWQMRAALKSLRAAIPIALAAAQHPAPPAQHGVVELPLVGAGPRH